MAKNLNMRSGQTIAAVQEPIIPIVAQWTRKNPNTLSLGQGMVFYPPPQEALNAIRDFGNSSQEHHYGTALGDKNLLALIAQKLRRENRILLSDGYQVMVTAGANMAFLNVLLAILDPGDEVILPVPYYFNQEMAVRMRNAVPVTVPTDSAYQLQPDKIKAAITEKTRAIVTVSPNNPTGAVYSEADLRAVNALCREYGLYHICDEAYEYFVYGQTRHFSPASIPGAADYTISLYSLSKAYGFASWRVGYAVVPEHLLSALLKVQDTNLICPPLISQRAAAAALTRGADYCRSQLAHFVSIRRQILERLQEIKEYIDVVPTEGAFYLLVKIHTSRNDLEFVQNLIQYFHVSAIPGCAFGLTDGCHMRLSYGMLNAERAEIAMTRLIAGIKSLAN